MKGDFSRDTFDPHKHFRRVLQQQGRVQLDADANEQTAILLHYLQTLATDLIGPYAGPKGSAGFEVGEIKDGDFSIGKGRYYVDGILCENDANTTYQEQKDYPHPPDLKKDASYLVYLDVWEHHITALEHDYIREKALGGPDTASRTKVVYQVKVETVTGTDTTSTCKTIRNDWLDKWVSLWQPANRGLLKIRVNPQEKMLDPCLVAPDAKYRGPENQLYRIEIHAGGKISESANRVSEPAFKWSRDNGTVVSKVLSFSGKELTVGKILGFEPGSWVELSNEEQELRGEPGCLAKLLRIDGNRFIIEPEINQLKPEEIKNNEIWPTKVRRWDQRHDSDLTGGVIPIKEGKGEADWIKIEHGIEVLFVPAAGEISHQYRSGDYWLIPARVATGYIEWPSEKSEEGVSTDGENASAREPFGIQHHYAPLAVLTNGKPENCRCQFQPIDSDCKNSRT
ncbi:MAG: DUF6519 domain-containing protein [Nitrosomonas sp.]|nr:MAG: DUF6519 domain-containing protein [Nitrosomonas sp.]